MVLSGVLIWYFQTERNCPAPLAYSLGELDASFNLSEEEALQHIAEAEAVWEEQVNRDLFVYDASSDFAVNFIFDDRQAGANTEAAERATLDAQRAENDEVIATIERLQRDYDVLSAQYEARVADYEARLKAYNARVNQYNDRGGAPSDVFAELEEEREQLASESTELNQTAANLNKLAQEINELGQRGERMVNEYNREVSAYNAQYGFEREFTQGDYMQGRINIYKFSSDDELVTVLAHEFGHALGIDHVEAPSSLMYYLLDETSFVPSLSAEDITAYYSECGAKESFAQRLRYWIRTYVPFL